MKGDKKKVAILVSLALILAITAIAINAMSPEDVSTLKSKVVSSGGSGEVGIEIQPAPVEDKLAQEIAGAQS